MCINYPVYYPFRVKIIKSAQGLVAGQEYDFAKKTTLDRMEGYLMEIAIPDGYGHRSVMIEPDAVEIIGCWT